MRRPSPSRLLSASTAAVLLLPFLTHPAISQEAKVKNFDLLTGESAMGDWTTDAPGVRRKLTLKDLPPPNEKESVRNQPKIVKRLMMPGLRCPKVSR
nr:hypothetical protein [Verrucomicrobium spinosum]